MRNKSWPTLLLTPLFDDDFIFDNDDLFDDDQPEMSLNGTAESWQIMIVDDEVDVHLATKLSLQFLTFDGKALNFISAYSGEEAKRLITEQSDIALIVLDVVMESNDSGLKVVKYIREVLQNEVVRIILRTGQPGEAPEQSVILTYDINDYKTKAELTQQKLFRRLSRH